MNSLFSSDKKQLSDLTVVGADESSTAAINPRFLSLSYKNPMLILVVVLVVLLGIYLILTSSADSTSASKVWSSAADWNAGTLTNTVVNDSTVELSSKTTSSISTTSSPTTDLALHKTTHVSSTRRGRASYITDVSKSTAWGTSGGNTQWAYTDLGKSYSISDIKLSWASPSARTFQVQVSTNASDWTTIYATTEGSGGITNLTNLKTAGRYVRVYITNLSRGSYVSISDLSIYGSTSSTTTTTTTAYSGSGSISLDYDASVSVGWSSLANQATLPTGTSIAYEARTSTNDSSWSSWTSVPSNGSLSSLSSSRYIQVLANFSTTNTSSTPRLTQLVLDYNVPVASPTASLSTSSSSITAGQAVTLSWSSTNATSCTAAGAWSGTQSTSGSLSVSPATTSTYDLSCAGSSSTATATPATITVTPATTTGGGSSNSSAGCTYSGALAPCVGSATTGQSGWGSPVFDDEFNGTSINTSTWNQENNWFKNNVTVSTANESESGGNLILTLASSTSGAEISTSNFTLPVGGFAEARVEFPGNGTSVYNWPAWWTAGGNNLAYGEADIFEGLGSATLNYHYNNSAGGQQSGPFDIPGTWTNSFHIFGLYRGQGYDDIYWDGQMVKTFPTTDGGGAGESLILTNGCYSNCTDGAQVKVDYVRAWE